MKKPLAPICSTSMSYVSILLLACLTQNAGFAQSGPQTGAFHLKKGLLSPYNRAFLDRIGDRLQASGKERLILIGTLAWGAEAPIPVRITTEWPDKLRVDMTGSATVFDGSTLSNGQGSPAKQSEDLLNSLVFDFVDHYFLRQLQGTPMRLLGPAEVQDPSLTTPAFWNMVESGDQIRADGKIVPLQKTYGFDTATNLLSSVSYAAEINGASTRMQTQFGAWQQVQEQYLPAKIVRFENGSPDFTVVVSSFSIGASVADGLFNQP